MKFLLKISPVVSPAFRHKVERFLETLGAFIIGGGQTIAEGPDSFSDISFDMNDARGKDEKKERYVLGFLFDKKRQWVLLIEKKRPWFLKGLYNGIGGRIEPGETEVEAMRREGFEEAQIKPQWIYGGVMSGNNPGNSAFECYIFYAYDDIIFKVHDLTEGYVKEEGKEAEHLGAYCWKEIMYREKYLDRLVPDARFLIPFGMDKGNFLFKSISLVTR